MGVPKLSSFVSRAKFGVTRAFQARDDSSDKVHLIFDGPSFAYWHWKEAKLKYGASRYAILAITR